MTEAKRLRMDPGPLIGTHNGHFHADEALAVYLLRMLPTYNPSALIRTRDPALLSTCHTVVDVGGEYLPAHNRYDHHQRTFTTTFPSRPTKLSSAGLVYMHFGKPIIALQTGLDQGSEEVDILWKKVYQDFIEALDAHDNGISLYDPSETKTLQKRFYDGGIGLGSLVGDLNANFEDAPNINTPEQAQEAEDTRFLQASSLMGSSFLRRLQYYHRAWLPARTLVHQTYDARKECDAKGRIMLFPRGCPWKDHLYTLEAERPDEEKVMYVLYPESEHEGAKWRVQAVSVSKDSFESRKPLPDKWRGIRDDQLSEMSGIEGCIFAHASGFIGGNKTREGALEMATKAIEL
ncbi:MAG: hypothetical protein ALECFALPRED_001163 [Alectoria fallacina]|uniref:MYG1 protein n=1 Tax=Alectoria fallacina TaxID=1903189 RepID=A0A8H3F7A3_9LECA|nr:MAG: hypothetical protein ALECFALPRED_001163 [Alectoria fallacina]